MFIVLLMYVGGGEEKGPTWRGTVQSQFSTGFLVLVEPSGRLWPTL